MPRPTPAAWRLVLVTVGLLAAAINTGNNLIYLMFSLLVAVLPVSALLGAFNLRRLSVRTRFPSAPRVGAPYTIDVELAIDRAWPAARSLRVGIVTDPPETNPLLVERIGRRARLRVSHTARGRRRGPLKVEAVSVRSSFPLGLLAYERRFDCDRELLVLPSARRSAATGGQPSPEAGADLLSGRVAGTEYAGLRRAGDRDDSRKVDWKVSARRGVTIVRETAGESRCVHRIQIDTRCKDDPAQAHRRFEERISQVAGQAQAALERGDSVRLSVDAAAARVYAGSRRMLPLLRLLAQLKPTDMEGRPLTPPQVERPEERSRDTTAERLPGAAARALRVSALCALTIGAIALFVADAVNLVVLILMLGSIAATAATQRVVTRPGSAVRGLWHVASVVVLAGYLLDITVVRRDLLLASLTLTVFITLFTLFNAYTTEDDRRVLMVSLLHIVLASALTTEVAIALPLGAWLFATIYGLMAWTAIPRGRCRSHAAPRRLRVVAPAAAAWVTTIVVGLAVFAAVPHFGTGAFRPGLLRPQRVTGFSGTTSLGDIGRIKLDQSKVMEIAVNGTEVEEDELRWRGLVHNQFDGRSWSRSSTRYSQLTAEETGKIYASAHRLADGTGSGRLFHQEIRLEPAGATALFAASQPAVISTRDFRLLGEDGFGNLEFPAKPTRRLSYSVTSELPRRDPELLRRAEGPYPIDVLRRNLELPDLDPRVETLAADIARNAATRYDKVTAIEHWLSTNIEYTLDVNDRGAQDPLARFLFEEMGGQCEYFATAMVVLSRELGIPARFVAGYLSGERNRFDDRYVVRQSNAHSWVEVYFPGHGWLPFDPTPPGGRGVEQQSRLLAFGTYLHSSFTRLWDDYLVGIDLDDQARGLLALTAAVNELSGRLRTVWRSVEAWHPLRVAALLAALVLLVLGARKAQDLWRTVRPARRAGSGKRPLPDFYEAALSLLSRRGLSPMRGETPAEFATRAEGSLNRHAADRLKELTGLYYRVRFDSVTEERDVSRIARALLGDVRDGLRDASVRVIRKGDIPV